MNCFVFLPYIWHFRVIFIGGTHIYMARRVVWQLHARVLPLGMPLAEEVKTVDLL